MSGQRLSSMVSSLLLIVLLSACSPAQTPILPTSTLVPTLTLPPPTSTVPPTVPLPTLQPTAAPQAAEPPPLYAAHGPYAVGARDFGVQDGDHIITFTVWYPALNPDNAPEEITYLVSERALANMPVKGRALQNAAPDTAHGPYPLVIYWVDIAGFRQESVYLLEHLASYGFVAMASDPRDSPEWAAAVTRPKDTKLAISFAEKATAPGGVLDHLIDTEHIAVVGWGTGGWTALVGGGAQYDLGGCAANPSPATDCGQWTAHAQEIATQLGLPAVPSGLWPPMNEARVGAVIALGPEGGLSGAQYEGVAAMKVPTLVVVGTQDSNFPPAINSYPIYKHLGSAQKGLIKFEKADFPIFFTPCRDAPWFESYMTCQDPNWDIDRAHDLINHFATAFLMTELKGDQEAAKALAPENVSFAGIRYETSGFAAAK